MAWAVLAPPSHVPLPVAANACTVTRWSCTVLHLWLAMQPGQPGCVLDPFLMPPPFPEGRASSPWSVAWWCFRLRSVCRILASCFSSSWIFALCLWMGHIFNRAPRWAPNVPSGWLDHPRVSHDNHTPTSLCLGSCFPSIKHSVPAKTKGCPRGRLRSDTQVNTRAKKQKCVSQFSSQKLCKKTAYLVRFLTTLYIV